MTDRIGGTNEGDKRLAMYPDSGMVRVDAYVVGGGPSGPFVSDKFSYEEIVELVNSLPGVEATYTTPQVYLPKGIGAVISSRVYRYVRTGEDLWQNIRTRSTFNDEEMRAGRKGKPYEIISEGVEL